MAAFQFNIAKGRSNELARRAADSDGELRALLLRDTGLQADTGLRTRQTVASILGGTSNEATFGGYARQALTGLSVTVDDAGAGTQVADFNDPMWSPTSSQSLGKIVIAYVPPGASADSAMIPLWADDFVLTTPTSGSISYLVAANGIFVAA